jgi:type III secretion protein D
MSELRELELRVLDGEQQGARCSIAPTSPTVIGGDWSADVVLRGKGLAERCISVTPHAGGVRVSVLHGDAQLGERRLQAGDTADVPLYVPLRLGETAIALGQAGDEPWAALASSSAAPNTSAAPTPTRHDGAPLLTLAQRWSRRLVAGGGAVAAVSAAMLAFAYTAAPAEPSTAQLARRAEAALHAAGFPRLAVQAQPNGEIAVTGYLETNAQRTRIEQLLAAQALPTRLSVWVNEQVASAVVDVYRVNGVTARAEPTGPGAVRVSTQENDLARLEQIRAIARRDVPGLAVIDTHNAAPPAAPDHPPVVDDPGKRVASIVPGDPSYVVTADGTRYFEGALLPTGHRIAHIAEREVLLERAGTTTPLKF